MSVETEPIMIALLILQMSSLCLLSIFLVSLGEFYQFYLSSKKSAPGFIDILYYFSFHLFQL